MFNDTMIPEPIPSMYPLYSPRYCVLYLDMHSGNGVMQDHSGKGNTGTVSGAAQSAGPGGLVRKFDGVDDYISIATDIIGTGVFTTEFWIFTTGWGENNFGNLVNNSKWVLRLSSSGAKIQGSFANSSFPSAAANSITLNAWQQVVMLRDSNDKVTFYVNGVISGTAAQAAGTSAAGSTVYIGNVASGIYTFAGSIGIVRFYNAALSASDILQSYRNDAWRYSLKA